MVGVNMCVDNTADGDPANSRLGKVRLNVRTGIDDKPLIVCEDEIRQATPGFAAKLHDRNGAVGAMRSQGMPGLNKTRSGMSSLMNKASNGSGTIGPASPAFAPRASREAPDSACLKESPGCPATSSAMTSCSRPAPGS